MTYREPDDEAMAILRELLDAADHAALAFEADGAPMVARVAVQWRDGVLVSLVSDLSDHTAALAARPDCALLVSGPSGKGDPLTHPRLSLRATAAFVDADDPDRAALRVEWLRRQPKAKLYIDFADFRFVRFVPRDAMLNAGFGSAYRIEGNDIR